MPRHSRSDDCALFLVDLTIAAEGDEGADPAAAQAEVHLAGLSHGIPRASVGLVCGQNAEHTWAPGEVLLPCCQRCTGLYVGAGVAALLHRWLRPRLSGRFLEMHGAFLVLMVPFGFHWLSQGPALRAAMGVLFVSGW